MGGGREVYNIFSNISNILPIIVLLKVSLITNNRVSNVDCEINQLCGQNAENKRNLRNN